MHVHGQSRLLDKITEVVIRARRSGGRFEIDDHGVRLAADGSTAIRFTQ
jgi:hypothetical protein